VPKPRSKSLEGITEGQVLQRNRAGLGKAALSGKTKPLAKIEVCIFQNDRPLPTWERKAFRANKDGAFQLRLAGIPAGGPYRLRAGADDDEWDIGEFFVGDVWVLAGQSNMEGCGSMQQPSGPHPLVRSFSLRREWRFAADPLHVLVESPDYCHHLSTQCSTDEGEHIRKTADEGVGLGIPFAREMVERTGVPQGLICTAQGGTTLREWSSFSPRKKGGSLYRSMIESVRATGQPVAGVLWYQGESDARNGDIRRYSSRMARLVETMRRDVNQPRLPWMIVQLARVFGAPCPAGYWNDIQEQQRLLSSKVPHLDYVAAIDLPLDDCIHISADGLPRLGRRLARLADRLVCGNTKEPWPPQLDKISCTYQNSAQNPCTIDVSFRSVAGKLIAKGEPRGFVLVNARREILPWIYEVRLLEDRARLYLCHQPDKDTRLGYGYGLDTFCNITDERDLSLPVFRPVPL